MSKNKIILIILLFFLVILGFIFSFYTSIMYNSNNIIVDDKWYLSKKSNIVLSKSDIETLKKLGLIDKYELLKNSLGNENTNSNYSISQSFFYSKRGRDLMSYLSKIQNIKELDSEQFDMSVQWDNQNDPMVRRSIEKLLLKSLEKTFNDPDLKNKINQLEKYFKDYK